MIVYEPVCKDGGFYNHWVVKDLDGFNLQENVIIAGKTMEALFEVEGKVYPALYLAVTCGKITSVDIGQNMKILVAVSARFISCIPLARYLGGGTLFW